MNVKVEDVTSIKKKLTFEVAADHVDKEIGKAFKKIGKNAKVKGFRTGKVPQSVLEQYYGGQMQQEVLTKLINDTYFKALDDHNIAAVGEPNIVDSSGIAKGEGFVYAAEVEIKPEITPKDYTGLKLEKEKFVPDPKVTEARLEEMRTARSQVEVSKHQSARTGDLVEIDYEGFIDDEPFDGGKAEGFELELGSGTFIAGFEDQIEGMQRNEEKDVEVTFPEDYGQESLAGKAARFKVLLHEIKEKVLPELDDEFAKGYGAENLDELKKQLDESYMKQEQNRIDGDLREKLVAAIIEKNPIEVPEAMVDKQLEYMLQNISNRMQSQGMSLQMLGITPENFRENYRDTAVDQVKGSLLLEAIGNQENIVAEESDIDGKLAEIAEMANAPVDAVKKYYAGAEAQAGLMAQIAEEKVIQFLLDKANIKQVAPEKSKQKATKEDA